MSNDVHCCVHMCVIAITLFITSNLYMKHDTLYNVVTSQLHI